VGVSKSILSIRVSLPFPSTIPSIHSDGNINPSYIFSLVKKELKATSFGLLFNNENALLWPVKSFITKTYPPCSPSLTQSFNHSDALFFIHGQIPSSSLSLQQCLDSPETASFTISSLVDSAKRAISVMLRFVPASTILSNLRVCLKASAPLLFTVATVYFHGKEKQQLGAHIQFNLEQTSLLCCTRTRKASLR
jgi:hypothetical protein